MLTIPTKEELLDFSRFDLNAILRGAQLTFVGAQRALQNPGLWTTRHYREAAIAVACGIAIRILIEIPIISVKLGLWFLSFFVRLDTVTWDDDISDGLRFLQEYVLQVPLFLMTLMRHITPAMDDLFMQSLQWVDHTYAQKHARDAGAASEAISIVDPRRRYYENLRAYAKVVRDPRLSLSTKDSAKEGGGGSGITRLLWRFGRRAALSLAVLGLSYIPLVGRFVLPATSFYTFRRAVGVGPAALIFAVGSLCLLFLPHRRYLVIFLQTYYGQRSLMRELLGPYLSRVRFGATQKRRWFAAREGLLFGFGAGFYVLLRVPLVGVLVYGLAEASTAYLVTKITDPPPGQEVLDLLERSSGVQAAAAKNDLAKALVADFVDSQQTWHNKRAFLELALDNLDALQRQQQVQQEQQEPQEQQGQEGRQKQRPLIASSATGAVSTGAVNMGEDPDRPIGAAHHRFLSSAGGGGSSKAVDPDRDRDPPPPYSG